MKINEVLYLINFVLKYLTVEQICNAIKARKILKKIDYISGPITMSITKYKSKTLLFFGDEHFSNQGECQYFIRNDFLYINHYLHYIFECNPQITFDLFLEKTPEGRFPSGVIRKKEKYPLGIVRKYFNDEKLNNLRNHYTDFRYDIFYGFIGVLFINLNNLRSNSNWKELLSVKEKEVNQKLNIFKTEKGFIEEWITIMKDHYSINKEVNKLKREDRDKLLSLIRSELLSLYNISKDTIIRFTDKYLKYDHTITTVDKKLSDKMNKIIISYMSRFVDAYVIARILKEYVEFAVLYFGNNHINFYKKFFGKGTELNTDDKRCIDIRKVKERLINNN